MKDTPPRSNEDPDSDDDEAPETPLDEPPPPHVEDPPPEPQKKGPYTVQLSTLELLKKHGFKPAFLGSESAHAWLNWRDYLSAFAPQLFQASRFSKSTAFRCEKT
jgi:hypothetical protein